MQFMFHVKLAKPEGMSNKEFYGLWEKEAAVALGALKAGAMQAIFKVPGKLEVIGILDAGTADDIDHIVHSLPLMSLGYSHLITDITWTPLRSYENWAADLPQLAA